MDTMKCNLDCLHCTIPQAKCHGGGNCKSTANGGVNYTTMVDGKKGQPMEPAVWSAGRLGKTKVIKQL